MTKANLALLALMCFLIAGMACFASYAQNRDTLWLVLGVAFIVIGLAVYRRRGRR